MEGGPWQAEGADEAGVAKSPEKKPSKTISVLQEVLKLMNKENLEELEVSEGSFQVKLVKSPKPGTVAPAYIQSPRSKKENKAQPEEISGHQVKSPIAGIFYRSRSPKLPPFVKVGDEVTSEQPLCIIEAMKVMNEITAGIDGKIKKIVAENGKPVQSDQIIFIIEPA